MAFVPKGFKRLFRPLHVESVYRSQVRFLNLHEFRAKELLKRHNVRVQRGILTSTPQEAKKMLSN